MNASLDLDLAFSALAHPVRRAILVRLSESDATVNELAQPFEMSLPAVSKHIRVLERAGLISQQRDAQFRPCSLNVETLREVTSWTEHCRKVWEARFDQFDDVLKSLGESKS